MVVAKHRQADWRVGARGVEDVRREFDRRRELIGSRIMVGWKKDC